MFKYLSKQPLSADESTTSLLTAGVWHFEKQRLQGPLATFNVCCNVGRFVGKMHEARLKVSISLVDLREYSSMADILGLYLGMMADLLDAEFR